MTPKIAVIGAGISGLATAYWLQENGYDVTVFEASDHVGGSIVTEHRDGYCIDLGPNSGLETSETLRQLIRDLGIEDDKVYANEASNKRYIVRNSELHPLAMSPLKFMGSKLFSTRAKFRLMKEPFIKPVDVDDISLADYVRYRLGEEFLDYAINPFVAGVYAGDPEDLSAPAGFPKLYRLEQKYGSFIKGAVKGARERKKRQEVAKDRARMFSFKNGMQTFSDTLAAKLKNKIRLNSLVSRLEKSETGFKLFISSDQQPVAYQFDNVIISTPTDSIAAMLRELAPNAVEPLENVKYPPVSVVFMGFKTAQIQRELDGFGFLIPKKENRDILGSIWSSTIFPNRAPDGHAAFTTFVGGTRQPQNTIYDDEKLSELVLKDLSDLVGIRGEPVFRRIKTWPRAIPQYTMGYQAVQQLFTTLEDAHPGLYFATNARRGISIGDSILGARETADHVLADLNEN